ncbi:unnamed protein product [Polarella glacialis]|uniref:Uncharacterized protein n=1 Tax=Polarella glacialis TaxID=89957 RepID=A0A813HAS9_POLGL|nr:unnamed protein product [Polarella glacialis]
MLGSASMIQPLQDDLAHWQKLWKLRKSVGNLTIAGTPAALSQRVVRMASSRPPRNPRDLGPTCKPDPNLETPGRKIKYAPAKQRPSCFDMRMMNLGNMQLAQSNK